MPLTIPAFDQYQAPLVPLRGLWRRVPQEGERFVNAEIDWLVTTNQTAVQFQLAGNSPVSISQIVAISVDNGRCGSDVDFLFPDSGFILTVPSRESGVYPVFTNALMFYASAPAAQSPDRTVIQILNSMPPPVAIPASDAQQSVSATGIPVVNGTTPLIPSSVSGTLNSIHLVVSDNQGAAGGVAQFALIDGAGKTVWTGFVTVPPDDAISIPIDVGPLSVRFKGGLSLVITNASLTTANVVTNLYYTSP